MNLDERMRDKQITNGPFEDMAQLAQGLKFALRRGRNWEPMPPESKEALELIATRIAKILTGDPNDARHWNDLVILAQIRSEALEAKTLEKSIAQTAQARVITPKNLFDGPRTPMTQRAVDELGDA
jgi:hypothetical protein